MSYTIQPGDTLGKIAQKLGTTVKQLQDLNGIQNANKIFAGQRLEVPIESKDAFNIKGAYVETEDALPTDPDMEPEVVNLKEGLVDEAGNEYSIAKYSDGSESYIYPELEGMGYGSGFEFVKAKNELGETIFRLGAYEFPATENGTPDIEGGPEWEVGSTYVGGFTRQGVFDEVEFTRELITTDDGREIMVLIDEYGGYYPVDNNGLPASRVGLSKDEVDGYPQDWEARFEEDDIGVSDAELAELDAAGVEVSEVTTSEVETPEVDPYEDMSDFDLVTTPQGNGFSQTLDDNVLDIQKGMQDNLLEQLQTAEANEDGTITLDLPNGGFATFASRDAQTPISVEIVQGDEVTIYKDTDGDGLADVAEYYDENGELASVENMLHPEEADTQGDRAMLRYENDMMNIAVPVDSHREIVENEDGTKTITTYVDTDGDSIADELVYENYDAEGNYVSTENEKVEAHIHFGAGGAGMVDYDLDVLTGVKSRDEEDKLYRSAGMMGEDFDA